jgi:hypothetical protein
MGRPGDSALGGELHIPENYDIMTEQGAGNDCDKSILRWTRFRP